MHPWNIFIPSSAENENLGVFYFFPLGRRSDNQGRGLHLSREGIVRSLRCT